MKNLEIGMSCLLACHAHLGPLCKVSVFQCSTEVAGELIRFGVGWDLWLAGSNGWDVGVLEQHPCRKLSC